jgi:hypothetical protein
MEFDLFNELVEALRPTDLELQQFEEKRSKTARSVMNVVNKNLEIDI